MMIVVRHYPDSEGLVRRAAGKAHRSEQQEVFVVVDDRVHDPGGMDVILEVLLIQPLCPTQAGTLNPAFGVTYETAPRRARTYDPLIKNQLLCRLS